MQSASADTFDAAYYQRYYFDKKTRVIDPKHTERLGAFVCSYLQYLRVPVHRVLDVGCGIGLWKAIVERHLPQARYRGVEYSAYLCERYGWERGSVVDYGSPKGAFDFVICQGVLPYLAPGDLARALRNLGTLCRGALYLEAVSLEDYARDIVDEDLTDGRIHRHSARLYRQGLAPHFIEMGGGLWLSRQAQVPVFALEASGA